MAARERIPLLAAVRDLRARRQAGTGALYLVLAFLAVLVGALPFSRPVQRRLAAVQHLRPPSVLDWCVLQVLPKMYGAAHRAWLAAEPLTDYLVEDETRIPFAYETTWVNHYPARLARFESRRAEVASYGLEAHVFLRTTYRGETVSTALVVRFDDGELDISVREGAP